MNDNQQAPPPIKRLRRSSRERVIAGVCGGLAQYLGTSPTLVRVLWLIAAFWKGIGILAYLLAIVLIPREQGAEARSPHRSGRLIFGTLLVIVGLFFLVLKQLPFVWIWMPHFWGWMPQVWPPFRNYWLPTALIVMGVVILMAGRRGGETVPVEKLIELGAAAPVTPAGSRLRRSRQERVILGICGGLGLHLAIDPALVRIIWVVGTLATGGLGLIIYILLYFLMPAETESPAVKTGR